MKKIVTFLFIFFFIPFAVDAKEYCTVVSGNGKDIGSEINCADEHFYIIGSDNDNIKMLAKYNLYIGYIVDKKEEIFTSSQASDLNVYCQNKHGVDYVVGRTIDNEFGERQYYCYKKEEIVSNEVKQNSFALGAHGGYEGHPEYPEVGVVQLMSLANYYTSDEEVPYLNYVFMKYDFDEERYVEYIPDYFIEYKKYLNNKSIDIIDMKLITIDEIDDIVKSTSNHSLPLDEWGIESWNAVQYHYGIQDDGTVSYYKVGSLKDNLDKKYDWLWQTTYWTQTMYYYKERGTGFIYFIDTLGNICADYDCPTNFGAGIRPVVTISSKDLKYSIKTKTDGKGTIEVVDTALGGESITFKVSAKKGLRLAGLIITTDSGEVVEFSEEDLTTNTDGTISISTNKFTMPYDNVLIEAKWTLDILNPKTGVRFLLIIFVFGITIFLSIKVFKIKRKS